MTIRYADVIIDISHEKVDRPFQYMIPEEISEQIQPGVEVMVPFGKGNTIRQGYVTGISDVCTFDPSRLKYIQGIASQRAGLESRQIRLAAWIREQYGSTMIAALKTVLPVKQKTKAMEKKTIVLLLAQKEAEEKLVFFQKKKQTARSRLLEHLLQTNEIPQEVVLEKLNISRKTVQDLETQGIIKVNSQTVYRSPISNKRMEDETKELSQEQQSIIDTVLGDFEHDIFKTYLIHGITGSGKTEVYMNLAQEMAARGRQTIMLIPEIALTYQTVMRFYNRFGDRVSVMNSKLSAGERFDQFEKAKNQDTDIMIGPRSALFAPFQNLGLIIIDEEHETSYKSESMPRYHAREVAQQIAKMCNACVVLGSATPSLESYYKAKKGEYKLFEMTQRLTGGTLPNTQIVDLREEMRKGNRSIFSTCLSELIEEKLTKKEQIILFINRRGYAGFVSCRSCGHVMKCPHCAVSLSEHRNGKLICHYCGYEEQMVSKCPECSSKFIAGFRAGTQQIEEQIKLKFPQAKVLRMDADSTRKKESYDAILSSFANHEADILLGTQMIVKGHDFPAVTLVGILAADLSLHVNDFRAAERTFQLITQAAGRAGRGESSGEVVIQTYQPDHYSLQYAANHDYLGFYEEEIVYREMMLYPPVAHLLVILILSPEEFEARQFSDRLAGRLRERITDKNIHLVGPAPATIEKINDIYRYVLYARACDEKALIAIREHAEEFGRITGRNSDMIQFDFDPMGQY